MAWASSPALSADDWIVVAQQADEPAGVFSERVRHRARRLRLEDASIESVDVYAAPSGTAPISAARWGVIEELGSEMAPGGSLTLWSASGDAGNDVELRQMLAEFGPMLAKRQIAMNHQACESEPRSGVRHSIPTRDGNETDAFDVDDLSAFTLTHD